MSVYTDRSGAECRIVIDAPAVERCRSRVGVDLYDFEKLGTVAPDMMRFLRVIHCVIAPGEDFGEWWTRHTGDAGERCVSAFIESLCDEIYPSRIAAIVRKTNQEVGRAVEEAWAKLENEHAATLGSSLVEAPTA